MILKHIKPPKNVKTDAQRNLFSTNYSLHRKKKSSKIIKKKGFT